jgi:hypothetical protein
MTRLTRLAHATIRPKLKSGDIAIDLTVGNGFDTLFLAQAVAPTGHVHGFDIQAEALAVARERLSSSMVLDFVTLHQASHENWSDFLDDEDFCRIKCLMMNLGYLPGGDESVTTHVHSTLRAIEQALQCLPSGCLLSILGYTGHPGGLEETQAALQLLSQHRPRFRVVVQNPSTLIPGQPVLWIAKFS